MQTSMQDKLIIALDVESAREALNLFSRLRPFAGHFKIGSKLFTAAGPQVVREMAGAGARIFLDLKFHDIPAVTASACVEATRLGVSIFTVHATGGSEMMRRTAEAITEIAEREGVARPRAIGVTVLTSLDNNSLAEVGISYGTEEQVRRLTKLAFESGLDGVVASSHEVGLVRETVKDDFIIVVPGVRPAGVSHDDQKRVMTPAEALRTGADYLVIGRAIINAPDPEIAAQKIIDEMEQEMSLESGV
ncbi:MAG TPA: orotidine-5'-phosphate decarboxylase [Pyrinomonadaceae bacterium]|nr:orotidine-5'-phosphate decarboxylase [Pyrinomonadaceae bacterium]